MQHHWLSHRDPLLQDDSSLRCCGCCRELPMAPFCLLPLDSMQKVAYVTRHSTAQNSEPATLAAIPSTEGSWAADDWEISFLFSPLRHCSGRIHREL